MPGLAAIATPPLRPAPRPGRPSPRLRLRPVLPRRVADSIPPATDDGRATDVADRAAAPVPGPSPVRAPAERGPGDDPPRPAPVERPDVGARHVTVASTRRPEPAPRAPRAPTLGPARAQERPTAPSRPQQVAPPIVPPTREPALRRIAGEAVDDGPVAAPVPRRRAAREPAPEPGPLHPRTESAAHAEGEPVDVVRRPAVARADAPAAPQPTPVVAPTPGPTVAEPTEGRPPRAEPPATPDEQPRPVAERIVVPVPVAATAPRPQPPPPSAPAYPAPPAEVTPQPRVSIEIGEVVIRIAGHRPPVRPAPRRIPPRAHAIDPRLQLRGGG